MNNDDDKKAAPAIDAEAPAAQTRGRQAPKWLETEWKLNAPAELQSGSIEYRAVCPPSAPLRQIEGLHERRISGSS
jgi:hypothetical protein